jgi:hypothetical protein
VEGKRSRQPAIDLALDGWTALEPDVAFDGSETWKERLYRLTAAHMSRFPEVREAQRDRRRADDEYRALLPEVLYEVVHNLRHLAEVITYTRPRDGNEYDGCAAKDLAALSFRHVERVLDARHVARLERDAPGAAAHLDHAIRNVDYIMLKRDLEAPQVAKAMAWTTEHLLRMLVSVGQRAATPQVATMTRDLLTAASLNRHLARAPVVLAAQPDADLRDGVRLVRLGKGHDGRRRPTVVACFTTAGRPTSLWKALKAMEDPPPRPVGR